MKIELDIETSSKEDGPEMTHNTYAIVKHLAAQSINRQLATAIEKELVGEVAYRAALTDLLEWHKQVN
jgi:hypothetical protein